MSSLGSRASVHVSRDTHRTSQSKIPGYSSLYGLLSRRQKANGENHRQLKTSSNASPSSLTLSLRPTVRCASSFGQSGPKRSPFPAGSSKIPNVPVTVPASQASSLQAASPADSLQDEEASWLNSGATSHVRRRSRKRRSSSSSRSTVACQAVAAVDAASPLCRKNKTPGRKAQSKVATCYAAATCEAPLDLRVTAVRSPEAESIPDVVAISIDTTGAVLQADNRLRGVQELLEHAWQLPCSPRDRQGQGRDLFRDSGSSEAEVEAFVSAVLSSRRNRNGRSKATYASPSEWSREEAHTDLAAAEAGWSGAGGQAALQNSLDCELGRSPRLADPSLIVRSADSAGGVGAAAAAEEAIGGTRFLPAREEEALVSRLALALSLAVAEPLPTEIDTLGTTEAPSALAEEEVLVKFPGREEECVQRRSPTLAGMVPVVRRRRSIDAGRRLLVRSVRKGRLSLQSRMQGATSSQAQDASTDGGIHAEVSELLVSDEEAVLDELLKGYGWKGDFLLEWDSERRLLCRGEEKQIIVLLEKGQALEAARAQMGMRLGRPASLDELARELQCSGTQLRRTLQVYSAARNKLVMHNLGLVVNIARLYRSMGYGVDFASLCQRGAKGLYDAADKFNSKRKCRFSTFASICVRTVVTREIAASMHVRAPTYSSYKFLVMRKAEKELEHRLRRKPTEKELAAASKLGVPKLQVLRRLFMDRPTLLHQEVKGGEGLQLADILPDRESTRDAVEKDELSGAQPESVRYALDDVIDSLKPKEALIIRQRFGLDGYGERSLAEIGRNLAISREMVRKYEARALAKLQLKERTDLFHSCLCDYSS